MSLIEMIILFLADFLICLILIKLLGIFVPFKNLCIYYIASHFIIVFSIFLSLLSVIILVIIIKIRHPYEQAKTLLLFVLLQMSLGVPPYIF